MNEPTMQDDPMSVASLNAHMVGMPVIHNAPGRITLRPLLYELKVLTKKRGVVRLGDVIKPPQEMLITEVERQLNTGGRVRIIVLKARQMGLSTVIEGIIFVLSVMYNDMQSLIVSHESESSQHILGITRRYWSTYMFKEFHSEQYVSKKQLAWEDTGSNITVATAANEKGGRSKTLHNLHASEVAFWDDAGTLMHGLLNAVTDLGITCVFLESTANGIGNYYHSTWQDAEAGGARSDFTPVFYPWFLDPEYDAMNIPLSSSFKVDELGELDVDELSLRAQGVSDSKLRWRRWQIMAKCEGSVDVFKQEYPSNASEAFLTTGRNVFRLQDLLAHYKRMVPTVGYLSRNNVGKVVFTEDRHGPLKVYRFPAADKNWGVYQIGADPTHTTVGDNACAQVFNRRTMEQCAVYSKQIDAISFGDELFLLGEWYNTCTVANETTGPGFGTTGQLNGLGYPMIYQRLRTDDEIDTGGSLLGWISNMQTKHQAIGWLIKCISQPLVSMGGMVYGFQLHDEQTFLEMRDYVVNEKGGFENGKGQPFDDCVMATGICAATHYAMNAIEPVLPYLPDTSTRDRVKEVVAKLPLQAVGPRATPVDPRPTGQPRTESPQHVGSNVGGPMTPDADVYQPDFMNYEDWN